MTWAGPLEIKHAEVPEPVPAGLGRHWSRDQRRLQRSGRIRRVLLRRVRRGLAGITRTIRDAAGVTRAVRANFTPWQTVAELAQPGFVIAEVAAAALRPALLRDRAVRPGSGDGNACSDSCLRVLFLIRAAAAERERHEEQCGAPEERSHARRILRKRKAVYARSRGSVGRRVLSAEVGDAGTVDAHAVARVSVAVGDAVIGRHAGPTGGLARRGPADGRREGDRAAVCVVCNREPSQRAASDPIVILHGASPLPQPSIPIAPRASSLARNDFPRPVHPSVLVTLK
jgi:hypothetical protein